MTRSILAAAVLALAAQAGGSYHLLKTIPLGPAAGGGEYFDYLTFDAASRRVFLSHGTEVLVVNADSGTVAGKISGLQRCHGVALVPDLGRGYISDGGAGEAVVFDLKTLKVVRRIKAAQDADSIIYDPASKRIFVFEGDANSATVIDPAKNTVVKTISLGGAPEQAVADGGGMIYDNLEDKDQVIAIDSRTLQITARWPVAPGGHPVSMAIDPQRRLLFIGCRNPKVLLVMDASNGKIVGGPFPIGGRVDSNIFDPETRLVAASTGDGAIDIFHEDSAEKLSPFQVVKTQFGAKTMALDPKMHNLLVDTADFESSGAGAQGNRRLRAKPGTFHLLIYGQ